MISSNSNLALYGQGLLKLTGQGDAIKGQRLSLSLFYNITVRYQLKKELLLFLLLQFLFHRRGRIRSGQYILLLILLLYKLFLHFTPTFILKVLIAHN